MVDSAYGIQEITIDLDEDGKVSALWFNRESYEDESIRSWRVF